MTLISRILLATVSVVGVATLLNSCVNGLCDQGFSSIPCLSPDEAKKSSAYVCPAFFYPSEIHYYGHSIEFGDAWVEKRSKPSYFLVWLPYRKIVKGYELCFTLKSGTNLFRTYPNPWFFIGDRGGSVGMETFYHSDPISVFFWDKMGEKEDAEIIPESLKMSLLNDWKDPRPKNIKVTFGKHP